MGAEIGTSPGAGRARRVGDRRCAASAGSVAARPAWSDPARPARVPVGLVSAGLDSAGRSGPGWSTPCRVAGTGRGDRREVALWRGRDWAWSGRARSAGRRGPSPSGPASVPRRRSGPGWSDRAMVRPGVAQSTSVAGVGDPEPVSRPGGHRGQVDPELRQALRQRRHQLVGQVGDHGGLDELAVLRRRLGAVGQLGNGDYWLLDSRLPGRRPRSWLSKACVDVGSARKSPQYMDYVWSGARG